MVTEICRYSARDRDDTLRSACGTTAIFRIANSRHRGQSQLHRGSHLGNLGSAPGAYSLRPVERARTS